MTISERVFSLITSQQGKSAAGLCKALGLNASVTTNWKQRNTDPPAKYIIPICEYLEVSTHFLLTGTESQDAPCQPAADEALLLQRYRALDEDGKELVRATALQQLQRVSAEQGKGSIAAG